MTTYGHLIIDVYGADISKVMHGVHQCYAQYFNFKHKRHGHVFQGRFKSKVVDSEEYLFTLSAYISELDEIGLGLIDGDGCYKNIKWHNA